MSADARLSRHYETSLSRIGYSIAAGGIIAGAITALLLWAGGQHSPFGLVVGWLIGASFSAIGIVSVAGPLWLVLHLAQRRGPWAAAATGLFTALLMFVGAQTYGFGLFSAPVSDGRTLMFRWISAGATGLTLAVLAMLIGLVMWRIAYRRVL